MPQITLSFAQRLAWWMVTSRVAGGVFWFAWVMPECVAALIAVVVVFGHPGLPALVVAGVCTPILFLILTRGVWFLWIVGAYLTVCNPARFSRTVVEEAIFTVIEYRAWHVLLPIYGRDQIWDDIRAAESFIHDPKPEAA